MRRRDCLWLFGAIPAGLALPWAPAWMLSAFFAAAIPIEVAHGIAPMLLAWSRADFRRVMLARLGRFVLTPTLLFTGTVAVGIVTTAGWSVAFPIVATLFFVWNIQHFGGQWFGLYRLFGGKDRSLKWLFIAASVMLIGIAPYLTLLGTAAIMTLGITLSLQHWMAEIGLCSMVAQRRRIFVGAALLVGCSGLLWLTPGIGGNAVKSDLEHLYPLIACLWWGTGFVHFWFDGCMWRMSDPDIRATLGVALKKAGGLAQ